MTVQTAGNRPTALIDPLSRAIVQSWNDRAYRGEVSGGNLIYVAFARPGSAEGSLVWMIKFIQYSGGQPISITYPQNASGHASNDYEFSWTLRATYTYS